MNKVFYASAIGFLFGALSGYFVARRVYEKTNRLGEEVESLKAARDILVKSAKHLGDAQQSNDAQSSCHTETFSKKKECELYEQKVAAFYGESSDSKEKRIRVLSDDELYDYPDFNEVTLTYYRDGVIADDDDAVFKDAEKYIGTDALEHFDGGKESVIYVLNSENETVYEILWSYMSYKEILEEKPYLRMEDDDVRI